MELDLAQNSSGYSDEQLRQIVLTPTTFEQSAANILNVMGDDPKQVEPAVKLLSNMADKLDIVENPYAANILTAINISTTANILTIMGIYDSRATSAGAILLSLAQKHRSNTFDGYTLMNGVVIDEEMYVGALAKILTIMGNNSGQGDRAAATILMNTQYSLFPALIRCTITVMANNSDTTQIKAIVNILSVMRDEFSATDAALILTIVDSQLAANILTEMRKDPTRQETAANISIQMNMINNIN